MRISGFQKTTLLDYPGKVACTVFTAGCNLRCPFCHNARLVTHISEENVPEEEIFAYLTRRRGILEGICVTGGEPTLAPDLAAFLARVRSLGLAVKLDTNGTNPEKLRELVGAGLVDYVAMDVKNAPAAIPETVGIPGFDISPMEKSIDYLLSGVVDYEFRTTVVAQFHTPERMEALCRRIAGAKRYFIQNFVNSGDLIGTRLTPLFREDFDALVRVAKGLLPEVGTRGV